jgi:fumarate hydratase class II
MTARRVEYDSLGPVNVPADKLWGAQTQRSLKHFSIGDELIPREMIPSYAIVKKAAALVNHKAGRLGDTQRDLIVRVCDELLEGQHQDQFPLHVWMTGSGTQFNMNVNEVIADRRPAARQPQAGSPQRSCEYVAVVERLVPDRDERGGRHGRAGAADADGGSTPR